MIELWFYSLPILFILGIVVSAFAVEWTGKYIVVFHFQPLINLFSSRDEALPFVLRVFFSWAWFFILLYPIFGLLLPLAQSSLVSQTLWLRLTPVSPFEVAFVRTLWVISWACWLGILGIVWALFSALYHNVSPATLLTQVWGLVSFTMFSGGIILATDFGAASNYFNRFLVVFIAVVAPLVLGIVWRAIPSNADYMKFFPHTIPFAEQALQGQLLYHYTASAALGFIFLSFHVLIHLRYSAID